MSRLNLWDVTFVLHSVGLIMRTKYRGGHLSTLGVEARRCACNTAAKLLARVHAPSGTSPRQRLH